MRKSEVPEAAKISHRARVDEGSEEDEPERRSPAKHGAHPRRGRPVGGAGGRDPAQQRHGRLDESSTRSLPSPVELGFRVHRHRPPRLGTRRAARELLTLFEHQWKNGKVPHIVFNPEAPPESYFPGAEHWACAAASPEAPPSPPYTSCLCQPPVHAIAALRIRESAADEDERAEASAFLREIYPKLFAWHRYLATARDPEGSGLVTIYHPWESGTDNSPRWDDPLAAVEVGDLRLTHAAIFGTSAIPPRDRRRGLRPLPAAGETHKKGLLRRWGHL